LRKAKDNHDGNNDYIVSAVFGFTVHKRLLPQHGGIDNFQFSGSDLFWQVFQIAIKPIRFSQLELITVKIKIGPRYFLSSNIVKSFMAVFA